MFGVGTRFSDGVDRWSDYLEFCRDSMVGLNDFKL